MIFGLRFSTSYRMNTIFDTNTLVPQQRTAIYIQLKTKKTCAMVNTLNR